MPISFHVWLILLSNLHCISLCILLVCLWEDKGKLRLGLPTVTIFYILYTCIHIPASSSAFHLGNTVFWQNCLKMKCEKFRGEKCAPVSLSASIPSCSTAIAPWQTGWDGNKRTNSVLWPLLCSGKHHISQKQQCNQVCCFGKVSLPCLWMDIIRRLCHKAHAHLGTRWH